MKKIKMLGGRGGRGGLFMSLCDTLYVGPKSAPGSQMTLIFYPKGPKKSEKVTERSQIFVVEGS